MRVSALRWLILIALLGLGIAIVVLFLPGCGRTSLEPEELDSSVRSTCGPASCPNGCCDANGVCRTGRDVRACGSIGGQCADCVADGFSLCNADRVCGRDQPSCGATSCGGCCAAEEGRVRCLSGTQPAACGQLGGACVDCAEEGRVCSLATRTCGAGKCDATNCTGCCVGDQCLPGNAATACGTGGQQCEGCGAGQACRAQSAGGGQCDGPVRCSPETCSGCCDASGRCVAGNDTTACGQGGQACSVCPFDQVCVQPGLPNARTCQPATCSPQTCPGCCVGNQCVTTSTPSACGSGGDTCRSCSTGQVCREGQCVTASGPCGPANCDGCCLNGICTVGLFDEACGLNGATCQSCLNLIPARECIGGSCQLGTCSPQTCPNGCCSGNTCVTGTQGNACGTGGGACDDCTSLGLSCQNQQCSVPCGPGTCPNGCCDPFLGCRPGNTTAACGTGGVTCASCAGSFCNGLVVPRRCNTQQSTCPAPYGACPPGVAFLPIAPAQNACSTAELNALAFACATSPDSAPCRAALAIVDADCDACLDPFKYPFTRERGIWACAASEVDADCQVALGCAADCVDESCDPCTNATENACRSIVSGVSGQCSLFRNDAVSCASAAINTGLCSQVSYPSFGQWFRTVGDHFCGDGQ